MFICVYENKNNNPECIAEMPFTAKRKENVFQTIDRFFAENGRNLFGKTVASHGIMTIRADGDHRSSWHTSKGSDAGSTGRNSCVLSPCLAENDETFWQNTLSLRNEDGSIEDTGRQIGVSIYENGYIISTGREGSNLFGVSFPAYISKITPAKICSSTRSGAKVFANRKKLIEFLEKYERTFKFCVSKYGYHLGYEPATSYFAEKEKLSAMTVKGKVKADAETGRLNALLEDINRTKPATEEPVFGSTQLEEAINRMKSLKLDYGMVIAPFKDNGKLFMSEAGGILYDLNKTAQKAVDEVRENNGVPYHVVRTGPMYAVLYVSENRDEWQYEVYDIRTEAITASVYNEELDCTEDGDIGVRPTNGGLVRTW